MHTQQHAGSEFEITARVSFYISLTEHIFRMESSANCCIFHRLINPLILIDYIEFPVIDRALVSVAWLAAAPHPSTHPVLRLRILETAVGHRVQQANWFKLASETSFRIQRKLGFNPALFCNKIVQCCLS